jgi:hypothetical protein
MSPSRPTQLPKHGCGGWHTHWRAARGPRAGSGGVRRSAGGARLVEYEIPGGARWRNGWHGAAKQTAHGGGASRAAPLGSGDRLLWPDGEQKEG